MKKLVLTLAAFVFMFFSGASLMAQENNEKSQEREVATGFIDTTGDGVCDNYDGTRPGQGLGPGTGKGEGRATGQGAALGEGLRDGSGQREGVGRGEGNRSGARDGRGNGRQLRDGSGDNCTVQPSN
ncbi:hypothetical protein QA597_03535 [Marinilabiliaceae bacterium ANBcel2]|nr:hypothetical protein [Marinilabiliaceae bacterium ANBcel2]